MDGDLISRSSFAEFIKSLPKTPNGHSNQYSESDILYYIENQPTAYDVEKVVEQIKKSATDEDGLIVFDGKEPMIWKSKAVEIVRKGGVE